MSSFLFAQNVMSRSLVLFVCLAAIPLMIPSVAIGATLFTVESLNEDKAFSLLRYEGTDQWYKSHYWTGPGWTRIGCDWLHPGDANDASRTFLVPKDGKITITGAVRKLHLDGDGIIATILHDNKEVWRREIEGKDAVGIDPNLSLDVHQGDRLRFVVNRRQQISCDTTGWNPIITYKENGEKFSAAESFSDKQGNGGWYYEMNGPNDAAEKPVITITVTENDYKRLAQSLPNLPDFDMFKAILTEWIQDDQYFHNPKDSIRFHFEKIGKLLDEKTEVDHAIRAAHESLKKRIDSSGFTLDMQKEIYIETRLLKRSLLFSDQRLRFGEMLFVKSRPPAYSHLVGQYFGWNQRPGGGLYVLEQPGFSLKHSDLIGQALPQGHVLEPRISYDAQRIAFSHVEVPQQRIPWQLIETNERGGRDYYYHLYEMNVDGSGLRQLTDECYDDMMPEYLPDGGLVFVSTRRKAYSRCFGAQFGKRWHSYTLFRMDADTNGQFDSNHLTQLSFNDVSEWFPTVSNTGTLLFSRWDYIDRDAVTHQNLWAMRPDGTNPVAIWGNATERPHCTFQAKAIPDSNKIVFIASAHHSITGGPVCLLDPTVHANSQEAITRISPGPYPEAESWNITDYYNSPYPLGEDLFLVAYSRDNLIWEPTPNKDNALGLYVLDVHGNRELLYRDEQIGSTCPIPLVPRAKPPIIRGNISTELKNIDSPMGEMLIANVYDGLDDVAQGTLRKLRVVQIFPKTTVVANNPRIGVAGEENTRAILGVVPIEEDGSARFLIPAGKPLLFQVLDEEGFAYQTMRSTTSVMPGEVNSCIGCHEDRMKTPSSMQKIPTAFYRSASLLESTPESGRPFGFVEMVQPILDNKCVECHNGERSEGGYDLSRRLVDSGHTISYVSLCKDPAMVPRYVERNQIQQTMPGGKIGARGSGLIKLLKQGHEGVGLTSYELERIGTWIDLNAVYYGSFDLEEMASQRQGLPIPMPVRE